MIQKLQELMAETGRHYKDVLVIIGFIGIIIFAVLLAVALLSFACEMIEVTAIVALSYVFGYEDN